MLEKLRKIKKVFTSDGLLGKSLRGGSLLSLGSMADQVGRFVRNIILVRLLAPEAFGLMATMMAAVSAIEAFTEVGLRQSVIHNKDGSKKEFLNIVWWISSSRGVLLYLVAVISAPLISNLFNKPEAADLLRIGFTVLLFNGLISPGVHALEKELRFKRWIVLMQGAGLSGVLIAIVLGFLMQSVWALVVGFLAEALLRLIFSFIICPFKPAMSFNKDYARDIFRYSQGMFGLPILMMIYVQTDIFVIGKVISLSILGKYALAKTISETPVALFTKIINPVLLPALSTMQDDSEKFRTTLLTMTKITTILVAPVFALLVIFAGPVLALLYGPEYVDVAGPLSILSLSYFMTMFTGLNMLAYLAIGRPNMHRNSALARTLVLVVLIYPLTVTFGALGASLAILAAITISLLVQLLYVKKMFKISVKSYFGNWLPGLQYSLIIVVPGMFLTHFSHFSRNVMLCIGIILCICAWAYALVKTWPLIRESLRQKQPVVVVQ